MMVFLLQRARLRVWKVPAKHHTREGHACLGPWRHCSGPSDLTVMRERGGNAGSWALSLPGWLYTPTLAPPSHLLGSCRRAFHWPSGNITRLKSPLF